MARTSAGCVRRRMEHLAPWSELVTDFRDEGFHERFAAKGQVERVGKVQKDLAAKIGLWLGDVIKSQDLVS